MAKKNQSQWDFGELFPKEAVVPEVLEKTALLLAHRRVLTVGELTVQVKRLLEAQVGQVWVTGEVTNLRSQASGHFYFTIKDADSHLNCVLFRDEARANKGLLQDGRKVVLQGAMTVYEPRGQYQLRVSIVELQGIGALQVAFERLKEKLKDEGLFANERKRVLPRYPQRIGIVTSMTGAAIRDVLHVIERRHPGLEIVVIHCRVQGQGAAEEVAEAITLLNRYHSRKISSGEDNRSLDNSLDLILVTRGGGSLEDLWAFNEEIVARAIFQSSLPIISAVGHEIDFSISDFVADLRAATPSAAAELITEGFFAIRDFVSYAQIRLAQLTRQQFEAKSDGLTHIQGRLRRVHPRRSLNETWQRFDDLQISLARQARQRLQHLQTTSAELIRRLGRVNPRAEVRRKRERLASINRAFIERSRANLSLQQNRLEALQIRLRLLGPEQVLARGYSITSSVSNGKIIRDATGVKVGQELRTRFASGEIRSVVKAYQPSGS